jgi:hypothetical protein
MSIEYRLRPIARAHSAGRFSTRPAHLFAYDGVECPAKSFKADGDASTTVTQYHTSVICRVIARTSVRAVGSFLAILAALESPFSGSLSTRPARLLQNCRISGMRRCHVEPRNTRTLVSSP